MSLQEEAVQIGGRTLCTVLRSADTVKEGVWQQYRLHKMYRRAGHARYDPEPFPDQEDDPPEVANVAYAGAYDSPLWDNDNDIF
eukprot:scaffold34243_cov29-Prasinocladus_malaysianus.AAC.2